MGRIAHRDSEPLAAGIVAAGELDAGRAQRGRDRVEVGGDLRLGALGGSNKDSIADQRRSHRQNPFARRRFGERDHDVPARLMIDVKDAEAWQIAGPAIERDDVELQLGRSERWELRVPGALGGARTDIFARSRRWDRAASGRGQAEEG